MQDTKAEPGDAFDQIRDALCNGGRIEITYVFRLNGKSGPGVQVFQKSRKVGPILIPTEDQTVADVLHMLGQMYLDCQE